MARPAYDRTQEQILDACKELFLLNGIRDTEMQQIAVRAGVSRSTLYRYNSDRDQLVFMVATDLMFEMTNSCLAFSTEGGVSGCEKLRSFSHELARRVVTTPGFIRFLSEMDLMYGSRTLDYPEARLFIEGMEKLTHREAQFLFEGLADDSIRGMEDPMGFTAILIHTIYGLAKCTIMGGLLGGRRYTASNLEEIDRAIDMMLEQVRADA